MGDDDKNNKEGTSPAAGKMAGPAASWRLNVSDFHMPERPKEPPFVTRVLLRSHGFPLGTDTIPPERLLSTLAYVAFTTRRSLGAAAAPMPCLAVFDSALDGVSMGSGA
nr:unnamed protein product [Digitaria exilis]